MRFWLNVGSVLFVIVVVVVVIVVAGVVGIAVVVVIEVVISILAYLPSSLLMYSSTPTSSISLPIDDLYNYSHLHLHQAML